MSYKIETVNDCTRKIFFDFEKVDLSDQIGSALKKKQATVSLKGFRKGKAPLSMVQKLYGPQIENEALYQFVSKEFFNAVETEGLKPIGYPQFSDTEYKKDDQSVKFQATVEIIPALSIKDFKGLSVERDADTVTEEDIDQARNQHLQSKAVIEAVEDKEKTLATGDFAILNFEGEKEDGSRPDNMKGEDFQLEIGSKQFIEGFEDGLIGMKAGEKKSIKLTFPENYHQEDLKSAPVTFHTELLEIKTKKLPDFTDELSKELGFESVEDFETKTKQGLEAQKKRQADEKLHQSILENLVEQNKFDVPLLLIENQKNSLQNDLRQNLQQGGFNDQMMEEYFSRWAEDLGGKAEFQVRSGLILEELAKKYEIEAGDEDLKAKFQEMADQSQMKLEDVEKFYAGNEKAKSNLLYAVREEKTFSRIKEEITIVQK
jgi:trigger factor